MDKQGFSVSEVNQYLKQLLESQSDLHHIPVLGEVSNFKRYASGHCYFTLKDEKSALKCVMFRAVRRTCLSLRRMGRRSWLLARSRSMKGTGCTSSM